MRTCSVADVERLYDLFYDPKQDDDYAYAAALLATWYETAGASYNLARPRANYTDYYDRFNTLLYEAAPRSPKPGSFPPEAVGAWLHEWYSAPASYVERALFACFSRGTRWFDPLISPWRGQTVTIWTNAKEMLDTIDMTVYLGFSSDRERHMPALLISHDHVTQTPQLVVHDGMLFPFGMAFITGVRNYYLQTHGDCVDEFLRPRLRPGSLRWTNSGIAASNFPMAEIDSPFWKSAGLPEPITTGQLAYNYTQDDVLTEDLLL